MRRRAAAALCVFVFQLCSIEVFAKDRSSGRDTREITSIVLHTIGGPACIAGKVQFRPIPERDDDALFWGRVLKKSRASAHYVIGRTGEMVNVLPVSEVAYHTVGLNRNSVGIELVHRGDGKEPFTESQISKLIALIKELRRLHPLIRIENIVMHSDIDQRACICSGLRYNRRQDPGANFPMERVIKEVRFSAEKENKPPLFSRLTGEAPESACVTAMR